MLGIDIFGKLLTMLNQCQRFALGALFKRLVGRLDIAYGEEGAAVQMMIGQSF